MLNRIHNLKQWVLRYERHLSSLALGMGFIIDSLTLKRIDLPFENFILIGYFVLVGTSIITLNFLETKKFRTPFFERIYLFLPFVIQFAFGGLFSGFTVFYSRSGSLAASWPFLLILVGLLLGNEILKRQYQRLIFQVTVFFTALFFFTIFFIPVLVGAMGPWIFILSGITSVVLVTLFVYILNFFVYDQIEKSKKYLYASVGGVFVLVNILYFTNVIPPIPLSLKAAGVYHGLIQGDDEFLAFEEKRSWTDIFTLCDTTHVIPSERLYVFSSVFAPTKIQTDVVHHWQYLDSAKRRWVSESRIPFTISGGRAQGYRGYSFKKNLKEGCWRVDVETTRGQVIGRILFGIEHVSTQPELEEKTL